MAAERHRGLSLPELSVLGDALRHGVVKVGLWRPAGRRAVGNERIEAAAELSRRGLLYPTGEADAGSVHCRKEEYVPTPRSRWTRSKARAGRPG